MKLKRSPSCVAVLCGQPPQCQNLIKPPLWRIATQIVASIISHMGFFAVWPCGLCVSPYRGSARRATRAAASLLPWGLA
jgi:hypothetical protein